MMMPFPVCHWSGAAPTPGGPYVNSVQQVSITIPSGSTSATATITSVGSLAFILYGGSLTNAGITPTTGHARVELTNSTTVTATRNTSSTATITVKCCVVDATSALVSSVQSGTVTVAGSAATGTASISSVNSSYAVIHHLGISSAQGSFNASTCLTALSYSGTTLTATRGATGTNALVTGYVVIEFNSSALAQAVQAIGAAWTNTGTSTTASITSVNLNNAILIHAGQYGGSSTGASTTMQRGEITNSTTVTINTNAAGSFSERYNGFVVEFASGVLNSSVQRGTVTLTGVTSNTATLSSVTLAKTAVNYPQYTNTTTSTSLAKSCTTVELTASTTLTAAKNTASSNSIAGYEVVEFS